MTPRPTVYRCFRENGELLYVGKTLAIRGRLAVHKSHKSWWHLVARTELEHFDTEGEMRAAERRAILDENPEMNVHWKRQPDAHPLTVLRQNVLLTPEELAERIDCNSSTIYGYEMARYMPSIQRACDLADALGVTFEDVANCFVPARHLART